MDSGIYCITNVLNTKRYVGSSKNLKKRKWTHWHHLKIGKHSNPHLQNAWTEYGSGAFHFMVLEYCEVENLTEKENYWIAHYDSINSEKGYNLQSADRREVSEETREKRSTALKGKPNPKSGEARRGKKRSPESIAKQSEALKGRSPTEEHRANLSAALIGNKNGKGNRGKSHTNESKQKMSVNNAMKRPEIREKNAESQRGRVRPEWERTKISNTMKGKPWSEERRAQFEKRKTEKSACLDIIVP